MTQVKAKGASVMTVLDGVSSDGETPVNGELVRPLPPVSTATNPTDPSSQPPLTLAHPKRVRGPRGRLQRWTTPHRVAHYFGVSHVTVCRWLRRKHLGAFVTYHRHYTDDRARKTERGRWRIFESDLEKLLVAMRVRPGAAGLGPGFWVGGGK